MCRVGDTHDDEEVKQLENEKRTYRSAPLKQDGQRDETKIVVEKPKESTGRSSLKNRIRSARKKGLKASYLALLLKKANCFTNGSTS